MVECENHEPKFSIKIEYGLLNPCSRRKVDLPPWFQKKNSYFVASVEINCKGAEMIRLFLLGLFYKWLTKEPEVDRLEKAQEKLEEKILKKIEEL
jgi:hypothetical protein